MTNLTTQEVSEVSGGIAATLAIVLIVAIVYGQDIF